MTLADAQQQRLLERLRQAGDQPVAFAELHAAGIDFPAAVVSELELNGYLIERVYDHARLIGVRLLHPEPGTHPTHPPDTGGAGRTDSQPQHTSRSLRMSQAMSSGACSAGGVPGAAPYEAAK
jgi:hypothetical protein